MKHNECYLKSGKEDWHQILGCNVHMRVARRMQRTIIRGQEGDDLLDEGAESAVYTVTGKMGMSDYQEILKIFRGGQPWFHDPFEDRQMKVIFSTVDYDSASGDYEFVLVEDIDPDDD
jgi:hypothetical protein